MLFIKIKNKILRLITRLRTHVRIQKIPFERKFLGDDSYGGWSIAITPTLHNSKVIFCGAGEDISFDIEFSRIFNSDTYIVDPTPRSIAHVNSLLKTLKENNDKDTNKKVPKELQRYNLTLLRENQIKLIEYALWNENKQLKFYCPKDPNHVSHSIVNFQNDYSDESISIGVHAITTEVLLRKIGLSKNKVEILKLDIEGAEHEVIYDLISNKIFPKQILVEFDELQINTQRAIKRFRYTHNLLLKNKYTLFDRKNFDFSYLYMP